MTCRVLGSVLALAVGICGWFLDNLSAALSSPAAVRICVFNADRDRVTETEWCADLVGARFPYNYRTIPYVELHAVVVHP